MLRLICTGLIVAAGLGAAAAPGRPTFRHLSSATGDLPVPGTSTQQTASLVADLDGNGSSDFVMGFRQVAPALVWYRRTPGGWERHVIEPAFLTVEAGGAAHDIDGDGDLDLVFGGDWQSAEVWWWENPSPAFGRAWTRRAIKLGGPTQHHDQVFGDFLGTGRAQLAFWNQGAKAILLAPIPDDPKATSPWPATEIFRGDAGQPGGLYPEGADAADVDGDGKVDLLAGNAWFKHESGTRFRPVPVGTIGGRIAAGRLKDGRCPQIVIAPGDGSGPLKWYECTGDPAEPKNWTGHALGPRDLVHGHTLALGDVDGDGHLDVLAAEMAKWRSGEGDDHPDATAWIFYGDGRGGFTPEVLATGAGFHEARLADLDGDGRLDVLQKPYTWRAPRVDVWLQRAP